MSNEAEKTDHSHEFNLYTADIRLDAFKHFRFYKTERINDKAKIRTFWIKANEHFSSGYLMARHFEDDKYWFLASEGFEPHASELGLSIISAENLPRSAALTFWSSLYSGAAGAEAVFFGTGEKYWQVNHKESDRICLFPKFQMHGDMVTCEIRTATFKRVTYEESENLRKQPYIASDDGQSYILGYPRRGQECYVKARSNRFQLNGVAWMLPSYSSGPLSCKSAFLTWMIDNINKSGVAKVDPVSIEAVPISTFMSKEWTKSKLKTSVLEKLVKDNLANRTIVLMDARTKQSDKYTWHGMVEALGAELRSFGLDFKDKGRVEQSNSSDNSCIFVCVDNPKYLKKGEVDNKEDVTKTFDGPIQCFTDEIFSNRRPFLKKGTAKERAEFHSEPSRDLYTSRPKILQMLNNELIKAEVWKNQLIYPRQWTTSGIELHAFIGVYKQARVPNKWAAVQVHRDGRLEFIEASSDVHLQVLLKKRGLIGVYRSDPHEKMNIITPMLEIKTTTIRVLPRSMKKGMSSHFTGVQIIESINGYYSGGTDAPDSRKPIERAMVVRACIQHGNTGPWGLKEVAATCYDPYVRLGQSTVWPGPFKLLNEYMRMTHGVTSAEIDLDNDEPEAEDDC